MLNNAKVGDIVVLVSGGPPMTVVAESKYTHNKVVRCGWFDTTTKYHELEFLEAVLIEQRILHPVSMLVGFSAMTNSPE
jgi:uncharacterized protein YodC (DUF2158 family)